MAVRPWLSWIKRGGPGNVGVSVTEAKRVTLIVSGKATRIAGERVEIALVPIDVRRLLGALRFAYRLQDRLRPGEAVTEADVQAIETDQR